MMKTLQYSKELIGQHQQQAKMSGQLINHMIVFIQAFIIIILVIALSRFPEKNTHHILTAISINEIEQQEPSNARVYFKGNFSKSQPKWCRGQLKFLDPPGPLTALASFPGSGNTWVRYLIQHATAYTTGCIYLDRSLQTGDFPGEGIFDGSVIAIKTHCAKKEPPKPEWPAMYNRVILLIRDPFDTLLAEFNRRKSTTHTGLAPLEEFNSKNWLHYVEKQSNEWKEFYKFYADNYEPHQLLVVRYEYLKANLKQELRRIVKFLGLPPNSNQVEDCIISKRQGSNLRKKPSIDLKQFFTPSQTQLVEVLRNYTFEKLGVAQ